MGLLSDPEYGSVKWVRILKRVHQPLCFLCYVAALVWFVMLANREFNNETYFSENALLPGLVTNEFNGEYSAKQFLNEYLQELEDKYDDTDEVPVPWLVAKMSQLGLEVHTHNFTLNYPLGEGQIYKGTNVYGILRAARTPSLEALVVTVPFRPLSSYQKSTAAGVALMLAFAQFARPQKYWAKDIIFLITEHEQLGMQAWLEAYHGLQSDAETFYTSLGSFWTPGSFDLDISKYLPGFDWGAHQKCLDPGVLKGRSGSIQAAINLEFHTPKIKYIEVKVEGLNGQLPNLDLVNLVHKLCVKSGIHHSYKNSYSWLRSRDKTEEWTNNIWTLLEMVVTQVGGVPNGNHGLFHRFGIEAVTLEGRDADDPSGAPARVSALSSCNFYRLGVALESILRSLNNLLERFHQSYFFYLLAATNRFVSIGQYMPSLCLMCVALLVRALALWVSIQKEDDPADEQKKEDDKTKVPRDQNDKEVKSSSEEIDSGSKVPGDQKHEELTFQKLKSSDFKNKVPGKQERKEVRNKGDLNVSVVNIGANYLLVHLIGYAVMNSPLLFSQIGSKYYDQPSEVSVFYGLIITSMIIMVISPLLLRALYQGRITREEVSLINILVLIELATLCLAVGMHNFPLGLSMATLYTPVALATGVVTQSGGKWLRVRRWVWGALCACASPVCALCGGACVAAALWHGGQGGMDAAMQAAMFAVADSLIYGNWLFNVATAILLPTWIIMWQILCTKVEDTP